MTGASTQGATAGTRPRTGVEVRWEPTLLDAPSDAVEAWARSIHGYAKRLPAKERAAFVMALDSALYSMQGEAAVALEAIHPKHRLMRYHDFFVERIAKGERVIDLGSGVGALAASIAQRCGAFVTGMDWSSKNLAQAREIAEAKSLRPAPVYVLGDITKDRAEGEYDVVILSNVLEHIAERPARLATWRRWYKPKRFLIRVPAFDRDWRVAWKKEIGVEWRCDLTHETEYTREQLHEELGEASLKVKELVARWGEYWLVAE